MNRSLRQFVRWGVGPRRLCRGFFARGIREGRSPVWFVSAKKVEPEQGNACANHISRRAQAHAAPARQRRGLDAPGSWGEGVRPVLPAADAGPARLHPGDPPATGPGGSTSARSAGAPWPNASPGGFHIVSWATDALYKVRTAAWRETRRKGVAKKGAKDPVKGARWALLKNGGDLTAGQRAQLECVANTNETLWEAYKLKERLRMILRQTADEAAPLLRQWAADAFLSGIPGFVRLGEKIARRHFDILRTIRSGLSNARLEAINNKIKTTIKIGYGYRNLDNLIVLVMLKCGGLNLQLPGRQ